MGISHAFDSSLDSQSAKLCSDTEEVDTGKGVHTVLDSLNLTVVLTVLHSAVAVGLGKMFAWDT